jgi:hypothetical protein
MYDLEIVSPDGSIGAVEITGAADAQQVELWKLVGGRGKRWLEPSLVGGWQIRILPSARARRLHSQLPSLLRDLESGGVSVIRGDKHRQISSPRSSASWASLRRTKGQLLIQAASTS